MSLETLIGMFAGITTIAFVPQVLRVYRSRSIRISRSACMPFCQWRAAVAGYGCMIGAMPVIVANGVTLLLAAAVLIGKLRFG